MGKRLGRRSVTSPDRRRLLDPRPSLPMPRQRVLPTRDVSPTTGLSSERVCVTRINSPSNYEDRGPSIEAKSQLLDQKTPTWGAPVLDWAKARPNTSFGPISLRGP